jgi:hypothetical protein
MRILMIAINDPAGTAIEFSKAVNKYTGHTCRLITKEMRYNFMFEKDIHLPWLNREGWDEVEQLLRESDVFHFHMTADELIELGAFRPVDYMKGKVIVHHHHGHPDFRSNPEKYRQKYRERGRRKLLVSTPDLLKLLPEARWQPNLVPIDDPFYTPLRDKPDEPIVICHSPTRKDLKNTKEFIQAVNEVRRTSMAPVELRLIENTPHKECLQLKRESHILFDHLQGYYGVSSLEGMSQGLCVIAGLDAWNRRHIEEFTGTGDLPWVTMAVDGLIPELKRLIGDPSLLRERASLSRTFMQNRWNDRLVSQRLVSVYDEISHKA